MDSRRFLLAIVLSAIVVIAYEQYLRIYYPASRGGPSETTSVAPDGIPENALPDRGEAPPGFPFADAVPADVPDSFTRPEGDVFVENDVFRARFASRGARLVSLQLKTYRSSIDQDSAGYQLVTPDVADLPLGVTLRGEESYPDSEIVYDVSTYYLAFDGEGERTLTFSGALPGGGRIEKRLRFYKDRYYFDVEVSVRGFFEAVLGNLSRLGPPRTGRGRLQTFPRRRGARRTEDSALRARGDHAGRDRSEAG